MGAACATLIIALCVEWSEHRPQSRVVAILSQTGQLSLTFYVAHVIIGLGLLEALGFVGGQSLDFAFWGAIGFNLFCIGFAVLWARHYRRGPLEAIFRRLTQCSQ